MVLLKFDGLCFRRGALSGVKSSGRRVIPANADVGGTNTIVTRIPAGGIAVSRFCE